MPFPAGGGGDVLTRMVAEKWAQMHGVATVIENRPGAATVLGVEAASRAAPDGNTLGIVANSFIIHPNFKKLSYDPLTSFEPVCLLANSPQVIVVNSASPYKTLTEWLDAARAKPGELSHASVGPASPQHIAFEQLKLLAKVNITFVPFNGNTPALNALLGGHVGSVMSNYSEAAELVERGQAPRARRGQRKTGRRMAERADGRRAGLQGLCGRSLVRLRRAGEDAEGQGRRTVEMVRRGDAGVRPQAEMGPCRALPRSAARPMSSPPTCASSRRTTPA